jgi:hypothetical protein
MIIKQFCYLVSQLLKLRSHPWLFPWCFAVDNLCIDSHCPQKAHPVSLAVFKQRQKIFAGLASLEPG